MSSIDEIRTKITAGAFEYSKHAVDQSILRKNSVQELREAIVHGRVIADYPSDTFGPSCLIFGRTVAERPIHIHCSYRTRSLVKIVTLHQPDPLRWIDYTERRG